MAATRPQSPNSESFPNERDARWRRRTVAELRQPLAPPGVSAEVPLRSWDHMRTVSRGLDEHTTAPVDTRQPRRGLLAAWPSLQGWVLAILVGVCSSLTGCLIELSVRTISSIRYGWCRSRPFTWERGCPLEDWSELGGPVGFFVSAGLGCCMAASSAALVFAFAPTASGSGIPEVKTILNGFVLSDVVSFRTLCVKAPGLVLSVSAGMALGKEGPLVHVAMCWAKFLSRFFPRFQDEGNNRREIFSAAAAAGVSTAFGAPLGGVLFSLEEVSSVFPSRTLLRAFTAAVAAAAVLQVADLTGTGRLTLFAVPYSNPCHVADYVAFIFLGVAGGLVGAAFNALNVRWSELRMRPGFRRYIHPVVEVSLIAMITLVTSWPLALTWPLTTEAIHALFSPCERQSYNKLRIDAGLCNEDGSFAPASAKLLGSLSSAAVVRFFQLTLTFGTACPAGLFVPSLFVGACLGRCVGTAMHAIAEDILHTQVITPGVYAMVGAGAVLGGVCRVTISLVVIMLELTGGLTYVVPFMLSVLVAKLVGDVLNEGIYDLYVVLKGYPFLREEIDVTFTERCCDIMETGLTKLDVDLLPRPWDLRHMLELFAFRGFPVVHGRRFIGFVRRTDLEGLLDRIEREHGPETCLSLEDILPVTDRNVMRMDPDAPLSQAHNVFRQLGCQHIFLVGSSGDVGAEPVDTLQGILSKKNFLRFLKSGQVGHMPTYDDWLGCLGAASSPRDSSSSHSLRFSTCQARHSCTIRRIRQAHRLSMSTDSVLAVEEGPSSPSASPSSSERGEEAGEAMTSSPPIERGPLQHPPGDQRFHLGTRQG